MIVRHLAAVAMLLMLSLTGDPAGGEVVPAKKPAADAQGVALVGAPKVTPAPVIAGKEAALQFDLKGKGAATTLKIQVKAGAQVLGELNAAGPAANQSKSYRMNVRVPAGSAGSIPLTLWVQGVQVGTAAVRVAEPIKTVLPPLVRPDVPAAGKPVNPQPTQVGSLAVNPSSVSIKMTRGAKGSPSGTSGTATGTVTLTQPAAASGTVVNLSCSQAGVVFPTTIRIPAGSTTQTFPITVKWDAKPGTVTFTAVNAGAGGLAKQAFLNVRYAVKLQSVDSDSSSGGDQAIDVCRGAIGAAKWVAMGRPGYVCSGIVRLDALAPTGGLKVKLASSSPAVAVDPSVTVPAGSDFARFRLKVVPSAPPGVVTLSATIDESSAKSAFTVQPYQYLGLSVNPVDVDPGGTSQGRVELDGPAPKASPLVVSLSASKPSLTLPSGVKVPGGQATADFAVQVKPTATPGESVTVNGSMGTLAAKNPAVVRVKAARVASISVPNHLLVGHQTQGTVALSGKAGAPTAIALASSSADVVVPGSVTIPTGQDKASFAISTKASAAMGTTVTLKATRPGASGTPVSVISTVIGQAAVQSVSLPGYMQGGFSYTGTVTLQRQAEAGGALVKLREDTNGMASPVTLPDTVTVPAGQVSASFPLSVIGSMAGTEIRHLQFRVGALRNGHDGKFEAWSNQVPVAYAPL